MKITVCDCSHSDMCWKARLAQSQASIRHVPYGRKMGKLAGNGVRGTIVRSHLGIESAFRPCWRGLTKFLKSTERELYGQMKGSVKALHDSYDGGCFAHEGMRSAVSVSGANVRKHHPTTHQ